MATFRSRLAPAGQISLVLAACALPVYTWSIIWFLEGLPGWLYHLSPWDIAGVLAYTAVSALVETLTLLLLVVALAALLPKYVLRERFGETGSVLVLVTAGWMVFAQFHDATLLALSAVQLGLVGACYLASLFISCWLVLRFQAVAAPIRSLTTRAQALLFFFYFPLSLLGVLVVVLRIF